MQISGFWMMFWFGCAGGVLMELLRWWKLRESANFPIYAQRRAYWLITLAMILAGGFIAAAYGSGPRNAIELMNLGAAAPAIIAAFAKQPGDKHGDETKQFDGTTPTPNRVRQFLAFG